MLFQSGVPVPLTIKNDEKFFSAEGKASEYKEKNNISHNQK
jgi:hypothetical protein